MSDWGLRSISLVRNSNGELVSIQGAVEEMTGYAEEVLLGNKPGWEDIVEPEYLESLELEISSLAQTPGSSGSIVYRIRRRDGKVRRVQEFLRSSGHHRDEPVFVYSTLVDIARGKPSMGEPDNQVKTSDLAYKDIFDASPDAIIETDIDGNLLRVSPATLGLFDYDAETEMAGKNLLDFIAREDRERAIRNLQIIREKGLMLNVEYTFLQSSARRFIGMADTALTPGTGLAPAGYVMTVRDVSRQKKSEWTLKSNQDLLRGITDAAKDSIILVNDRKQVTFWNPASEGLFGYSSNEMLGRPIEKIIETDERVQVKNLLNSMAATREDAAAEQLIEIQARNKDGVVFPAEMAVSGFFSGTRWNIVIVVREISDRKALENERVGLIHDLNERIKELDCLFRLSEIVEEPCATVEEILKRTLDLIPPAFQYPESTIVSVTLDNIRYRTPGFKMTDRNISAAINVSGKDRGLITVCRNDALPEPEEEPFIKEENDLLRAVGERLGRIIERIQTESELQESEERFRDLFENTSDLIQNIAPDGSFIYVNPAWKKTLGYSDEEINKMTLFDIIHPDCLPYCTEVFQKVTDGGKVDKVTATFVTKSGDSIDVEGSASCRFENGMPVSTRGIFRNVSDRYSVEKKFLRANAELKRFASTLSHDLKGSFTAIDTAGENLKFLIERFPPEYDSADILENIDIINRGISEATGFLDGLLALSRSTQPPEKLEKVDISDCVYTAKLELTELINSSGATIIEDTDLGRIRADQVQLDQLFTNLLAFLLKNSDTPDPLIELRFKGLDGNGVFTYFAGNNSPGISLENTESLFDPSFNGETGKMEIHLPVVERITRTYGGSISLADCDGLGFELSLKDFET
ncbi:MAG: PAS domain S-box protein [Actinobacteria bacterium]|nr:PAS domain S-box protein [Actinomycetota bacterium]